MKIHRFKLTNIVSIHRLINEYNFYIHRLIDKYSIFIFLLLPISVASSDGEPPKQA
jgi:hypothetical protein